MEDLMREIPLQERVVTDILAKQVTRDPNSVFFQYKKNQPVTYGKLDEVSNVVANSLTALGVRKGDNVGLMLPNCDEYVYTWFGLAKIGGVKVPINTAFKGDMLKYIIDHSDSRFLFISEEYLDRIKKIEFQLSKLSILVVVRRGLNANLAPYCFSSRVSEFEELLKGHSGKPHAEITFSDPLMLLYTSGTTGPSKGVICTHAHSLTFAIFFMKSTGFSHNDVLYTSLPFFHTLASTLGILPTLICGARMGFNERFSASRFWQDVKYYQATVAHVIFSIPPILAKLPVTPEEQDNTLRCMYLTQRDPDLEKRWNLKMVEVYGMTEIGIATYVPYGEDKPVRSCGKEAEIFDLMIADDNDKPLPTGEIGELLLRPKPEYPWVTFQQYYKMPEETLEYFRNLWYHTGDRMMQDEDGFFCFVDRKKDAIRVRGENVSSYEIERAVNQHPKILESAAIAVPSEILEDEIKICIVLKKGEILTPEELNRFCIETMPKFMVPRFYEIADEMPKSSSEKIQKYILRRAGKNGDGITENTWDSKDLKETQRG